MKTQNFGRAYGAKIFNPHPKEQRIELGENIACGLLEFCGLALRDYRRNRENIVSDDSSKKFFPSAVVDESKHSICFHFDLDFEEDYKRGYPEIFKGPDGQDAERYWFMIEDKETGRWLEGFSQEPDFDRGFPDHNGVYWYYFQFTDTECLFMRRFMEKNDLDYLDALEKTDPDKYHQEVAAHPDIQQRQRMRHIDSMSTTNLSKNLPSLMWGATQSVEHATNSHTATNAANESVNAQGRQQWHPS
ncbi:MAG: hypothetical protein K0R24_1115 [Gammaproteobacteria bacterium]|nr:hypothetical protein [Gammaproteobacteria bacterium]